MKHKSVCITLIVLIATMGSFVVINALSNFSGFLAYLGFAPGKAGTLVSWILASTVVAVYCWGAAAISDVKNYMFTISWLKALAVVAALCAGIVEEVVFRKWVMDYLARDGYPVMLQIIASALCFGAAHLMWGLRNIAAGVNAVLATAVLGLALAVVYWLSGRSLAPCVAAHFVISALIEPGLLIAANGNKLSYFGEKPS